MPEVDARKLHGVIRRVKDALGERAGVSGARRNDGAHVVLRDRGSNGCAPGSPRLVRAASRMRVSGPSGWRPSGTRLRGVLDVRTFGGLEVRANGASLLLPADARARELLRPGWLCIPARTAARRWPGRCVPTFPRKRPQDAAHRGVRASARPGRHRRGGPERQPRCHRARRCARARGRSRVRPPVCPGQPRGGGAAEPWGAARGAATPTGRCGARCDEHAAASWPAAWAHWPSGRRTGCDLRAGVIAWARRRRSRSSRCRRARAASSSAWSGRGRRSCRRARPPFDAFAAAAGGASSASLPSPETRALLVEEIRRLDPAPSIRFHAVPPPRRRSPARCGRLVERARRLSASSEVAPSGPALRLALVAGAARDRQDDARRRVLPARARGRRGDPPYGAPAATRSRCLPHQPFVEALERHLSPSLAGTRARGVRWRRRDGAPRAAAAGLAWRTAGDRRGRARRALRGLRGAARARRADGRRTAARPGRGRPALRADAGTLRLLRHLARMAGGAAGAARAAAPARRAQRGGRRGDQPTCAATARS